VKLNTIDVVIPARNEQSTVGAIIDAFHAVSNVGKVIVVDDKSTDDTWWEAFEHDAMIIKGPGEGKGQAVNAGLQLVSTEMVCFCDADLVGFTSHHASLLLDHPKWLIGMGWYMVLGVPEFTPNVPWAHKVKDTVTWESVSGERCLPTALVKKLDLHGYAMEAQINAEVVRSHVQVVKRKLDGVKGYLKPSSYGQRVAEWRRDLEWLRQNPI
jgi:hypothetical protein